MCIEYNYEYLVNLLQNYYFSNSKLVELISIDLIKTIETLNLELLRNRVNKLLINYGIKYFINKLKIIFLVIFYHF